MMLLGLLLLTSTPTATATFPEQFDWRNVLGFNFVNAVESSTNPPGCDAGWAFAAASMLGDRLTRIKYNSGDKLPTKVILSPQVLLNCATPPQENGCNGNGKIEWALQQALKNGIVDSTCMGYRGKQEECKDINVCVNCLGSCSAVPEYVVYNVSQITAINLTERAVQQEIYDYGPIACRVHPDASLPSGDRHFHASIVGYDDNHHVVANPNFGTYRGNDTAGFFRIPVTSLVECWAAVPHVQGIGTIGGVHTTHHPRSASRSSASMPLLSSKKISRRVPDVVVLEASGEPNKFLPPKVLDWRSRVALTPIRSHHVGPIYCGACYSMATTSTFSDMLKIGRVNAGNSTAPDTLVAAQAVIDCVSPDRGCFGNNAGNVFGYMENHGLPDSSCDPFQSAGFHQCSRDCLDCAVTATSQHECNQVQGELYTATNHKSIKGEVEMVLALQDGPIECMLLDSTPSFLNYKGGVLCDSSNKTGHNHDIELVGYGVVDGQNVWIGRNSWGTRWGMGGWFFICRGHNNLGIEKEGCYSVSPKLKI